MSSVISLTQKSKAIFRGLWRFVKVPLKLLSQTLKKACFPDMQGAQMTPSGCFSVSGYPQLPKPASGISHLQFWRVFCRCPADCAALWNCSPISLKPHHCGSWCGLLLLYPPDANTGGNQGSFWTDLLLSSMLHHRKLLITARIHRNILVEHKNWCGIMGYCILKQTIAQMT